MLVFGQRHKANGSAQLKGGGQPVGGGCVWQLNGNSLQSSSHFQWQLAPPLPPPTCQHWLWPEAGGVQVADLFNGPPTEMPPSTLVTDGNEAGAATQRRQNL